MIFYFLIWNFFYTIINNYQKYFNNLFFKYNKTNLFYNTKYNKLASFEMYFISIFFNINNFNKYYFNTIYNFKLNRKNILILNLKKIECQRKLQLFKLFKFVKAVNIININFKSFFIFNKLIFKFYKNLFIFKFEKKNTKVVFNILLTIFFLYFKNNLKNNKKILDLNNLFIYFHFYKNIKYFDFVLLKKKVNKFKFKFKNYKNKIKNSKLKFILNENLKNNFFIKFKISNLNKYLNLKYYNIMYIRKNKIFNKGRYSRNRQLYRTGVYWCLWVNIILVYGLYFLFYRFSFNFGYLWIGLFILLYSTIFSRILKYNFINLNKILTEINLLIIWFGLILKNLIFFINNYFTSTIKLFLDKNNFFKINVLNKLKIKLNFYFFKYFFKYKIFFFNKFINNYGTTLIDIYFFNYIRFLYNVLK